MNHSSVEDLKNVRRNVLRVLNESEGKALRGILEGK